MRTINVISAVMMSIWVVSSSAWAAENKCPKGQSWDKTLNACKEDFNALESARENTVDSRTYPAYTPGSGSPFSNDLGNHLPSSVYSPDTTGMSE